MPEVTPKWVEQGFLLTDGEKARYAKARQQAMVPVLTLNQIKVWLEEKAEATQQFYGYRPAVVGDLLAQVQGWKHTGDGHE